MAETQPWPDPSVVPPPDITSSTGGPISAPGAALGDQQFPGVGVDPYSATALASPRPKKQTSAPESVDQIPIGPEAEINKAAGYDPATGRIQPGGIYDLTRQKQEATEAADQRLINAEQEQLRQLREAHKAVAASPNDLKSWDAQKEQAKYSVSPTEAALNPGFWLAIAASAFTRTPMVNALNGAAASINSLKDGKDEEFKRAYEAWRQNSELAIKRHELMHQDYEDAIQLYDKDVDTAREQAKLVALKYDDKLALEYLRNGLDDKMIGLVDKRDQMFKDWSQTNAALPEYQVRKDVYNGMQKQINDFKEQNHLANDSPQIIALRNRSAVALGAKTDQDEAGAQAMFQWQLDHANDHDGSGPTAEEVWQKTNAMQHEAAAAKRTQTAQQVALQAFMEEHPNATAEQLQAFMQSGRAGRSAIAMYMTRYMQEHPNASADEVKSAAQRYTTETTAQNRFLSGPQGNTIRSLNVVVQHLETMRQLADAMKNGDWVSFNRISNGWSAEFGHAPPTNLASAAQIVGTEIIKAMGVAGAGTQDERQQAQNAFQNARSPEQIYGVIDDVARPLMLGQLNGLKHQFMVSTGLPAERFDEMLLPDTSEFFGQYEQHITPKPHADYQDHNDGWGSLEVHP